MQANYCTEEGKPAMTNTLEQQAEHLVKTNVYCHVNGMVEEILSKSTGDLDHMICAENEFGDLTQPASYWAISDWLAERLIEKGEQFVELDFFGQAVWGRKTFGQAIAMDRVIEDIAQGQLDYLESLEKKHESA
jgi:hypothetical protein